MPSPVRQEFLTTDLARLLVERDPVGSEVVNRLANPNGRLGGFGYLTPVNDTDLSRPTGTVDRLRFATAISQAARFSSHRIFMLAGQWVAAQWTEQAGTMGHRGRFAFFEDDGTLISRSTESAYFKVASGSSTRTLVAVQAPSLTAYVRWEVNGYSTSANANPAANTEMYFTDAIVATGPTQASVSAAATATAQPVFWTNVLPSCTDIGTNRVAIDLGTLSARVVSNALDPATSTTLRPGRRVSFEAQTDPGVWVPMFTGRTTKPDVEYITDTTGQQRAEITLNAYDPVAALAATNSPPGYTGVAMLTESMESVTVPVPYDFEGRTSAFGVAFQNVGNDSAASLLDQIVRTRDTNHGVAFVDKRGVVVAQTPAYSDSVSTLADTLTDADFNQGIRFVFDVDRSVNSVVVTSLGGGINDEVSSTTTGPIRSARAVAEWGELRATYTVIGVNAPTAFAQRVLKGNGLAPGTNGALIGNQDPVRMVDTLTVAISTGDRVKRYAPRDLWDLVKVTCTSRNIDATYRIRGIRHTLTAGGTDGDKWLTTYAMALPGRAPIPTT